MYRAKWKETCYLLDKNIYRDYKEVSSEMQTICFPTLPPVIMDWNAARKEKKNLGYLKT